MTRLIVTLAVASCVAGAGTAGLVAGWELLVRTTAGSSMWLRVESFRRFLAESEAHHAEEAAQRGVLRDYTAWAISVGEIDRWAAAIRASTHIPDERGTAPREMVRRPFAIPNMTAKLAALATVSPKIASKANATSSIPTAKRATLSGWVRRANTNSQMRAATCAGPNNAPIATTVAASMPARPKMASRCADIPDGTKA